MLPAQETRYIAAKTEEFSTAIVRHEPDFLGPNFQRLGTLDSHMISMGYQSTLEIPSVFPSRANVDVTFVPWLWAPVNRYAKR